MNDIITNFNEENIKNLFEQFKSLGFLIAILLPFIEALIPILPIALFTVVNVNTYGLFLGFLYTYVGASLGSITVFLIIRQFGQNRFFKRIKHHPHTAQFMTSVENKGVMPLFLLLCFPFTPSAIVNIVAGLTRIKKRSFVLTVLASKAIMLFTLSYIGNDIYSFVKQPVKSIIVAVLLIILYIAGKIIEKYVHKGR